MSEYDNMKSETYRQLYQKYLEHRPASDMVDLAGDVAGKTVWDLCCGMGEIAVLCAERGAKFVRCVDTGFFMTTPALLRLESFRLKESGFDYRINTATVEELFKRKDVESPDIVFCRQAVNYWMNENSVKALAEHMLPGSVLVFNTFNTVPDFKPVVKQYELPVPGQDMSAGSFKVSFFVEVSWFVPETGKVHHVQVRSGMEPHVTEFEWIHPEDFFDWLSPHFDISVKNENNTAIYRCTRR